MSSLALFDQLLETFAVIQPRRAAYRPMFHRLTMALIVQIDVQNAGMAAILPNFRRRILTLETGLAQDFLHLHRGQAFQPRRFGDLAHGQDRPCSSL